MDALIIRSRRRVLDPILPSLIRKGWSFAFAECANARVTRPPQAVLICLERAGRSPGLLETVRRRWPRAVAVVFSCDPVAGQDRAERLGYDLCLPLTTTEAALREEVAWAQRWRESGLSARLGAWEPRVAFLTSADPEAPAWCSAVVPPSEIASFVRRAPPHVVVVDLQDSHWASNLTEARCVPRHDGATAFLGLVSHARSPAAAAAVRAGISDLCSGVDEAHVRGRVATAWGRCLVACDEGVQGASAACDVTVVHSDAGLGLALQSTLRRSGHRARIVPRVDVGGMPSAGAILFAEATDAEMLRSLRARWPGAPLIAVVETDGAARSALEAEADAVLMEYDTGAVSSVLGALKVAQDRQASFRVVTRRIQHGIGRRLPPTVLDALAVGVVVVSRDTGAILYSSAGAAKILENTPEGLVGRRCPWDWKRSGRVQLKRRHLSVETRELDWGGVACAAIVVRDETADRVEESSIRRENRFLRAEVRDAALGAMTDEETGLPSLDALRWRVAQAGPENGVWVLRIGGLMSLADTTGDAAAGAAIRAAIGHVRRVVGDDAFVARVGYAEFVGLGEFRDAVELGAVEHKLANALSQLVPPLSDSSTNFTTGLHSAMLGRDRSLEVVEQLRERVRMGDSRGHGRLLTGDLFDQSGWIVPAAQPLVRVADGSVVGYELLTRTRHPVLDSPLALFARAKRERCLTAVDLRCLALLVQSASALPPDGRIHVNLFPTTILETPPERIIGALERSGLPLTRFCIELVERQHIADADALAGPVATLRRHGVSIALDDVGFGNSSIEALVGLQPDVVKIDVRCVSGVARSASRLHRLGLLLAIVEAAGALAIAEGVVNREDLDAVRQLHVGVAQGFHLGRPQEIGGMV